MLVLALLIGASPPAPVLASLRTTVLERGFCDRESFAAPAPLGSKTFVSLPDGRLLVFLQVPDYLCHMSNGAVPVLVDGSGVWRTGKPINGEIHEISRAQDGSLFVASEWQIEGSFHMLWRSKDGLEWTSVKVPDDCEGSTLAALCTCAGRLDKTLGSCGSVIASKSPWTRAESATEVTFSRGKQVVALPKQLSPASGGP